MANEERSRSPARKNSTAVAEERDGSQASLDLNKLLSACVHLARRAGHVIRVVHAEGQLGAHNKKAEGDERAAQAMDPAEVLTIADTRSQDAIVTSLRAMFPGIRIVGEEEESSGGKEPPTLLQDVPQLPSMEVPEALAKSLTYEDTCLWIDPLDGTIEFVRNNLHHVCVLIGIAVRNRPVAGVVFQPFVGGEKGIMTYGALDVGVFSDLSPAFGEPKDDLIVAMEEKHAKDPRLQAAMGSLGVSDLKITQGCGQNLLKVLRGETSVFVQAPGASRWDTCAAEPLLAAVGGKVTDLDGKPYEYIQGASSYLNSEGLIAARTETLHGKVAAAFADTPART